MNHDTLYDRIDHNGIGIISSLNGFGSGFSLKKLCSSIEKKDETELSAFLLSVDKCGAIDILTETCIIVEWTHDEDIINWFYKNCLNKCSLFDLSCTLKDRYLANGKIQFLAVNNDFPAISIYGFECFIWKNLNIELFKSLRRNSNQNIGIWFSGISSDPLTTEYLSSLEQYAFLVLIQTGTDIKESKIHNKTVSAITIKNICLLLSELHK